MQDEGKKERVMSVEIPDATNAVKYSRFSYGVWRVEQNFVASIVFNRLTVAGVIII